MHACGRLHRPRLRYGGAAPRRLFFSPSPPTPPTAHGSRRSPTQHAPRSALRADRTPSPKTAVGARGTTPPCMHERHIAHCAARSSTRRVPRTVCLQVSTRRDRLAPRPRLKPSPRRPASRAHAHARSAALCAPYERSVATSLTDKAHRSFPDPPSDARISIDAAASRARTADGGRGMRDAGCGGVRAGARCPHAKRSKRACSCTTCGAGESGTCPPLSCSFPRPFLPTNADPAVLQYLLVLLACTYYP